MVAKAANQSSEIQFGSIACMVAAPLVYAADIRRSHYSAGAINPVDGCAMSGLGVREVLRMLVLTKRVS